MNKRTLKVALIAMTALGVGALTVPFLGSLSPNSQSVENALQSRTVVDLAELAPGTFVEKGSEYTRFFVLRDFDGEIYVYEVRHLGDAYRIPDGSWDRPYMPCRRFGPEASGNRLVRNGSIRCHDPDLSDSWRRELTWSYSGKSMGERTGDIPRVDFDVRERVLMIKGSYWPLSDISQ